MTNSGKTKTNLVPTLCVVTHNSTLQRTRNARAFPHAFPRGAWEREQTQIAAIAAYFVFNDIKAILMPFFLYHHARSWINKIPDSTSS